MIWPQAKSEKAAEPRNHQDFGVNQPGHKISASFSVMDSKRRTPQWKPSHPSSSRILLNHQLPHLNSYWRDSSVVKNSGYDTSTHWLFSMIVSPCAVRPAIANAMAIR